MTKETRNKLNRYGYYIAVAFLSSLFTFIINWRTEDRVGYQDLLERYETKVQALEKRVADLEQENITLSSRLEVLSQIQINAPIPTWIKGTDGRMLTLNPAYERLFLHPYGKSMKDYVGLTDEEFWGSLGLREQGKIYWENDMEAITSRKVTRVEETVNINGAILQLIVYKYPYYSSSFGGNPSQIVGVAGLCVVK